MLSRREFLVVSARATTGTLATMAIAPLLDACGSSGDGTTTSINGTTPGCDGAGATSTTVAGHTHTLCVPASALAMPASEGATFETTVTNGHAHAVPMTQEQLMAVAGNALVAVTTSVVQGHAHDFSVERSAPVPTPLPQPGGPFY